MADRVSPFVHDLCAMDRRGGRCKRLDPCTWEVHDIAEWTDAQATRLRHRFPSLEAHIVSNRSSLSGFSLTLRQQQVSHAWASLLVAAILIATVAAGLYASSA